MTWGWGRVHKLNITAENLFVSFLAGGLLGMVTAALVETYLLPSQTGTFLTVGLIEETAKGTILYFVARGLKKRTVRDGLLLGATVGAGFAAFESAGYAFDAFNGAGQAGRPLLNVLQTEITRALLSPFGHIAWTALLGAALFAASGATGKLRLTGKVWATFVAIVAIHALWDASYGVGIILTKWFTGDGFHFVWPNVDTWVISPSRNQLIVFDVTYNGILVLLSILATTWIVHVYRHAAPDDAAPGADTDAAPVSLKAG